MSVIVRFYCHINSGMLAQHGMVEASGSCRVQHVCGNEVGLTSILNQGQLL